MLGHQHHSQIDQQPGHPLLRMANDGVDTGIDQARGFHVAFSIGHTPLPAECDDRHYAEDA